MKLKKITMFVGGFVSLLLLIAGALIYLVDINSYKPRLQEMASEASGMEVRVNGGLGIGLLSGVSLTMHDVHVRNKGKELVAVEKVQIGVEASSLFRDEISITGIALQRPKISVELGADGRYNFDRPSAAQTALPTLRLNKLSFTDGIFIYSDKRSGDRIEAEGCDLTVRDLLVAGGKTDIMQALSLNSNMSCDNVRIKEYAVSDLQLQAKAENGVFDLKPITLSAFGGKGSGSVRADYSGATPISSVRFELPQFRIEKLLAAQAPETAILSGPMSFSSNLVLRGKGWQQLKQSAAGDVLLSGQNTKLHGHDLDQEFSRYESSQNFSLLDMGALVIAGPVGMAVTKGRDFANVLQGANGSSNIRTFVSRWKVERGVMHAQDVAMATDKYRMAMLGGLDIAHARFVDVTLALLNHKGCAEVQQKINGPFEKPVVEQPNIVKSVAGPVLKLLEKGRGLLPGGSDECRVIYAGSVAAPR